MHYTLDKKSQNLHYYRTSLKLPSPLSTVRFSWAGARTSHASEKQPDSKCGLQGAGLGSSGDVHGWWSYLPLSGDSPLPPRCRRSGWVDTSEDDQETSLALKAICRRFALGGRVRSSAGRGALAWPGRMAPPGWDCAHGRLAPFQRGALTRAAEEEAPA